MRMEAWVEPNPYTPGETPRILAGREAEADRIRSRLSRVATFGEMAGPPLIFQGPRGVGKTSLLRAAQRDAEAHGFLTAWVAGHRDAPLLPDLVDRVMRTLADSTVIPPDERRRVQLRLKEIGVEFGVPSGVKVKASAEASHHEATGTGALISAVEDLLHDASNRIRTGGGAGLAIFLDELHAPSHFDLAVLLNAVQNLSGRREDNPLAVIGAGLPSTAAELTKAATFGERSTFVTLPRLEATAAATAVESPADALGVHWDPAAIHRLIERAQGFPYLLQVIAHETWDEARPEQGQSLTPADLDRGIASADEQLDAMYAARWTAAPDLEQRFMLAMARIGTGDVARSDIAAAMGSSSDALGVPRERLIDKGIIEPAGRRGYLRFTLPGFDQYLRDLMAEGSQG